MDSYPATGKEAIMNAGMLLPTERVMALDVSRIEAYLAAHGWEQDPKLSSRDAGIYHLPADPRAEVILPRDRNLVDYALRVGEVLQALAVAERRTAWEVLEQFSVGQAVAQPNGVGAGKRRTPNGTTKVRGKKGAP
jgi:hypothetical protein